MNSGRSPDCRRKDVLNDFENLASIVPLTSHFLHFLTITVVVIKAGLLSRGLWNKPQLAGVGQDADPKQNKRWRASQSLSVREVKMEQGGKANQVSCWAELPTAGLG